uniref:Uncharacterized protein n=1 Tax=Mustela putorius furo TaxID=9669 RepID=M3YMK8_MUSPF
MGPQGRRRRQGEKNCSSHSSLDLSSGQTVVSDRRLQKPQWSVRLSPLGSFREGIYGVDRSWRKKSLKSSPAHPRPVMRRRRVAAAQDKTCQPKMCCTSCWKGRWAGTGAMWICPHGCGC